jgi:hypothetical protein
VRLDLLALSGSKDDSVTRIGRTYLSCVADLGFVKFVVMTQPRGDQDLVACPYRFRNRWIKNYLCTSAITAGTQLRLGIFHQFI